MTQPGGASDGYVPRKYESEVYAEVAGANANKHGWDRLFAPDASQVAGQYSNASARFYEHEVAAEGTGYRPGLDASDVDYRGMPHERLLAMVQDGASAEEIDEQGNVINDMGNLLKELTGAIQQGVSKEQAGWQGNGAQAAFQGVGDLSKWMDTSGDAAFLTANRYSQASAAIANARNSMPEPAGRTVMQSMDLAHQQLASGDLLGVVDTYKNMRSNAAAALQAQQQAAQVLAARDQTLYVTGSTQPTYAAPPQPAAPVAAPVATAGGSVGGPGAPIPDVGRTSASSAFTPSVPSAEPAPTTGLPGGITTGSGPVGYTPPVSGGGDVGGWGRSPGSALNPGLDAGLVSTVGGTGGGGDIERGGSGRSGGRVPGGTEQEPAAGKRSGTAEPGAKAAAGAAGEGVAGKTGKAGASGMPGAAGGGKKRAEDEEHKRAVPLVEPDPETALGIKVETDEHGNKIAPPVIG